MHLSVKDRIKGCFLGGAFGDAIGAVFENRKEYEGFYLPEKLRVTDDTQLTLATCEAICDHKTSEDKSGFLADLVSKRMASWFRQGQVRGIGKSTHKALEEILAGAHWSTAGSSGEHSAGNGAAMRVAPLAFFLDPQDENGRQTVRDCCRITH